MRTTGVALLAIVLATTGTAQMAAQKGKPTPTVTGGPSDAVFADVVGLDRIRSDGYPTALCGTGNAGEESRYCGGTFTDPETNLTYEGVGPECSRISYDSKGTYSFRTISSKCETYPPLGVIDVQRRLILDFGGCINAARCADASPANDLVTPQVEPTTKQLNVCGENLVDDVRIVAEGAFTGSSAKITVYISLVSPPEANTNAVPARIHDSCDGDRRRLV